MPLDYKSYIGVGLLTIIISVFTMLKTDNNFTLFIIIGVGMILYGLLIRGKSVKGRKLSKLRHRAEVGNAIRRASTAGKISRSNSASIHSANQVSAHREFRYCPNCGARISSEYRFCPSCGARIR